MNLEKLNLSEHTFNMLCRRGLQTREALEAELDDPEKHEILRQYLCEKCYAEVMNALKRTIYPRTSLDEIGLSAVLTACARRNGISTAEELAESVSNPDSLWKPEKREKFCRHLKEHGYLETENSDSAADWDDTEFSDLPETEIVSVNHVPEVTVLSERQSRAVVLDTTIKTRVKIIGDNLYALCKELKEMRDQKLYKELNYQNFEEYCENEVHISRQYAYDHIGVIENLPEDFVKTSLQNGGVKNKLMMIAKASEPVRTQIMQEDPELKESYRKIKARCKELEAKQKQAESKISELESENQKSAQALDEITADKNQIQSDFEEFREGANRRQQMLMTNLQKRKAHEEELEAQLEELENQPRDTVYEKDPGLLEENAKLKTENQELKTQLAEKPMVQDMLPSDGESFSERRAEFQAYLKSLSDVMNHICAFVAKYQENHRISEVEKTVQKYINAMKG